METWALPTHRRHEDRRRKWIFAGLKIKRLPLLSAPSSLTKRNLDEAEEELIKHALAVAHATKAAAEAAVTTALVASEIVQFTSTLQYNQQQVNDVKEFSVIRVQGEAPQTNYQCVREIHESVVPRIQSAFRFYLVSLKKVSLSHTVKGFLLLVLECIKTKTQGERQNVVTVHWKSSSQDYLHDSAVESVVNRADSAVT